MRVKLLVGLGAGLALTLGVAAAQKAVPLAATAKVAKDYVDADKVPGLVIGIGTGNVPTQFISAGKIAAEPGAAAADENSLWRVYSMTKPITGMAAMMLIEDGKMKLDEPVSDFIPAFKNMRVLIDPAKSLDSRPAARPITIRNLLTHTAGLGYTIVTTGPLLDEYNRLGITPGAINPADEPKLRQVRPKSLAEFADRVATLPLIADPGSKWSYSIALDVMGRVIEVASGMPFDKFLQKRMFKPLKMNSTWFTVPTSEAPRLATNYFYAGNTRIPVDRGANSLWLSPPSFPYGGAGLVSSAHDYDRFLHMLQNGGTLDGVRVMKPATVKLAMSNLLPAGTDASILQGTSANHVPMGFGAGGSVYLADSPHGPGKGTYGWAGAASTLAWVDAGRRQRGVIMVNYMLSTHWPLWADAQKAIYTDLTP